MQTYKRYSNRKLYSVNSSRYVRLGDIRQTILRGEDICVMTLKGRDVTREILLSIIADNYIYNSQGIGEPKLLQIIRGL